MCFTDSQTRTSKHCTAFEEEKGPHITPRHVLMALCAYARVVCAPDMKFLAVKLLVIFMPSLLRCQLGTAASIEGICSSEIKGVSLLACNESGP